MNLQKIKKNIGENIKRAYAPMQQLVNRKEASFLTIVTLPKKAVVVDEKEDNLDKMVGMCGNPYAVADAIIRKSFEDPNFAKFWNEIVIATDQGMKAMIQNKNGQG